jgi:hypothetical protein
MRMLSGFERAARPPDDLSVLQDIRTLRDIGDADLVPKGDVLSELDLPRSYRYAQKTPRRLPCL